MPARRPAYIRAGFAIDHPIPELIIAGDQWRDATVVPEHQHAHWEVTLQRRGRSVWTTPSGDQLPLSPGDALLVPPGLPHRQMRLNGSAQHYAMVVLDLDAIAVRIPGLMEGIAVPRPYVLTRAAELLEAPFTVLLQELAAERRLHHTGIRAAVDLVAVNTVRLIRGDAGQSTLPYHPAVARAVALLQGAPERAWTLAMLADEVDTSANHLAGLLRRDTGETMHGMLTRLRIQRARERLRLPEATVTSVALDCGFVSPQHFARVFRQVTGQSPTQWQHQA